MKTFNSLNYSAAPRQLHYSRVIHAPLERVWDTVSDHQGMTAWMPMIRHVELKTPDSGGGWGEGCERNCQFGPDLLEETVVYWNPPHGYAYTIADMHLVKDHVAHLALERAGESTLVTWTQYFQPNGNVLKRWLATRVMMPGVMKRALANLDKRFTRSARSDSSTRSTIAGLWVLACALLLQACASDLRTSSIKNDLETVEQHAEARDVLAAAVARQGLSDVEDRFETYTVTATDHWRGLLGSMGRVWNWKQDTMLLRYILGDFDGQVEVRSGKKRGFKAGLQSHDYYEYVDGVYTSELKDDRRLVFALNAFHYFFELGPRLLAAPVIRSYPDASFGGQDMRRVFVSWGNDRSKAYDQYVVWIGKASGLIEAVTHTVRDNYLPGAQPLYSTTEFDDFRKINGVLIPFQQTVFLFGPDAKDRGYVHRLTVHAFEWDSFVPSDIRPNPTLQPLGDTKPEA